MVQEFNFDGIRIDTIPEVPKQNLLIIKKLKVLPKNFWSEYGAAAGVF